MREIKYSTMQIRQWSCGKFLPQLAAVNWPEEYSDYTDFGDFQVAEGGWTTDEAIFRFGFKLWIRKDDGEAIIGQIYIAGGVAPFVYFDAWMDLLDFINHHSGVFQAGFASNLSDDSHEARNWGYRKRELDGTEAKWASKMKDFRKRAGQH